MWFCSRSFSYKGCLRICRCDQWILWQWKLLHQWTMADIHGRNPRPKSRPWPKSEFVQKSILKVQGEVLMQETNYRVCCVQSSYFKVTRSNDCVLHGMIISKNVQKLSRKSSSSSNFDKVVAYESTTILENSFVTLLHLSQKGNREWIHQNRTQLGFISFEFWKISGKSICVFESMENNGCRAWINA